MLLDLQKEIREKMAAMEASASKPRVTADQMVAFLSKMEVENKMDIKELVEGGDLRRLAYGRLTNKMYDYTVKSENGEQEFSHTGKLYISGKDGDAKIGVLSRFDKEVDQTQYMGHVFTPEERSNLFMNGQAGNVIEIDRNHGKEGVEPQLEKCFVTYDRELNRFKAVAVDKISDKAFSQIYGQKLSEEQQAILKEGKPVLYTAKGNDGQDRNVVLQFDAFEFGLKQWPAIFAAPRQFLGAKLDESQRKALAEGQDVELHDMKKKDGTTFNAKVKLNDKAKVVFVAAAKQEQKTEKKASLKM